MRLFYNNLLAVIIPLVLSSTISIVLHFLYSAFSSHWIVGVVCLAVLSFVFNLVYAAKAGAKEFTELLLAAIIIKLLLAFSTIAAYSYFFSKTETFNFSIPFILHYILFTIFEIRYLLHIIKTHPLSKT